MRVVITGAGLVGRHTAADLTARGHEVVLADLTGDGVTTEQVDVRDLRQVVELFEAHRPDVVLHSVALMSGLAQADAHRAFETNVGGTLNVAEAVRRCGVRRLVHTSTLGVHDLGRPQTAPLDEDFPTGGNTRVYPASKVACEHVLRASAGAHGFELALLRLGAVYGAGRFAGGSGVGMAMDDLVRAVLDGRPGTIGAGLAEVDELVYVKDVASGAARAVEAAELRHDTYNVGAGRLTTTADLVDALARVVPGATAARHEAPRPGPHPRRQPMSLERSRAELGYEPRYDLEAGLRDYAGSLRAAGAAVAP